ncbi:MAG: dehydrogenase [Epulopiscium sp. Nele67-Bin004]|nr:MAG: dehydrogenase [Epulopiscium sp. Nele67-Bin004]
MQKVRLGIIGVGQQGSFYTMLLTGKQVRPGRFIGDQKFDNLEIGAFCEIDPQITATLKDAFPDIPVYDNYKEMLDSGKVDAVITCVPHYLHPEMGIEALNRNIHVLLEKPAGVYTKQVQEVIDAAAARPELVFGVFFNQRMNPLYRRLKEIIDNGEIGNIRRTNWLITTWYRPSAYYEMSAWRATWGEEGGGVLVNQAPHQIDLIQWLCGMPERVYAKCKYGYQRNIAVEDEVTAVFDYGNGATGVFVTCTHDLMGTDRLEILGDKGKIVVDKSKTATITRFVKSEQEIDADVRGLEQVQKLMSGGESSPELYTQEIIESDSVWGLQHADILRDFSDSIVNNTPLVAPGSDGINGVRLANAIHLSSWLDEEVPVEFDEDFFLEKLNEKIEEERNSKKS